MIALATSKLRRRLEARLDADPAFEGLIDDVVARRLDPASAAVARWLPGIVSGSG